MVSGRRTVAVSFDCKHCGKSFETFAVRAKYCNTKCTDNARYYRDKEKRLAQRRNYVDKNKKKVQASNRRSHHKYKEDRNQRSRAYYQANKERMIANALVYIRENPSVVAGIRHKRRGAVSHTVTARDFERLARKSGGVCSYCPVSLTDPGRDLPTSLQWDHVVPLSRGGTHSVGNLLPACRSCNLSKGKKFLTEWRPRERGRHVRPH